MKKLSKLRMAERVAGIMVNSQGKWFGISQVAVVIMLATLNYADLETVYLNATAGGGR